MTGSHPVHDRESVSRRCGVMDLSKIEWTERTWNPFTGCDRTSPGCDHCYALTMAARLKLMGSAKYQTDGDPRTSGPGFGVQFHPEALTEPLQWRKPQMVFVNSMSDLFHQDVEDRQIDSVWDVMALTRRHTYQVLTKRSKRMRRVMSAMNVAGSWRRADMHWCEAPLPLPNVWLGVSIESDPYAFRADDLRGTPAAVRFLSCEPLLGPLPSVDFTGIDWVIVGAESSSGARPMDNAWAIDIVERARAAGAAVFVKQLSGGARAIKDTERFPEALRVREYPVVPL